MDHVLRVRLYKNLRRFEVLTKRQGSSLQCINAKGVVEVERQLGRASLAQLNSNLEASFFCVIAVTRPLFHPATDKEGWMDNNPWHGRQRLVIEKRSHI